MSQPVLPGWDRLRHGGLLLDPQRLNEVASQQPEALHPFYERELRRRVTTVLGAGKMDPKEVPDLVRFMLQHVCGFTESTGSWKRGPQVPTELGRTSVTGEGIKPRQLWEGPRGAILPVFIDREKQVGVGRGRKATSNALQWLRAGDEQLALVTNGRQWRLVFAGLDFDAWCEWDLDLWLEAGELSPQINALRGLLHPAVWTPPKNGVPAPLLQAILDSRKGQAELSQVLGERVREAVETIVQSHGQVLKERCDDVAPEDIYRAAVRVVMRLVVVLFAESRELLPRDNPLYHRAYGLNGLLEELEKIAARGGSRLARSWSAWPRILALFRLVHDGSHHPDLPVLAYGGELFASGDPLAPDGLSRALAVFETACFEQEALSDRDVHRALERITRTKVRVRQGRTSTWVAAPVDFSDLSSEYIGILYEGLLDFELRTAPHDDAVVFLAVGNQPALPLSRLEEMEDRAVKDLLEKMKDTGGDTESQEDGAEDAEEEGDEIEDEVDPDPGEANDSLGADEKELEDEEDQDERHTVRMRAESWARRAVEVAKLVRKPRGTLTPEKQLAHEATLERKARQLIARVVMPGEWYLIRWGGTRKGSGTFYTRPGLAIPTVQRTLRPLAWDPPDTAEVHPDWDAPPSSWTPKTPEHILSLKVLDPACGSGTFPLAALRFLTDALYVSLHHHDRISEDGDRALVALLTREGSEDRHEERLHEEMLPCRPGDAVFEPRLKAVLRRHVVERCIHGVDLDPLAVELCRLALWIETMDRSLPFSFLDHKVKCGNGIVGAWFDQFQHYPVMAWKNREGGDKGHKNGVHFQQEAHGKALKAFVKDRLTPDLRHFLEGPTLFSKDDPQEEARVVHDDALAVLARLHGMPVHEGAERARIYREELLGSDRYRHLKRAMDLWCACWFWPADELDHAPLPTTFADPSPVTAATAERLAAAHRFFHWELEFPDVFSAAGSGFHAVIGNPPWETLQPSSKEFFSNIDPLYRAYGKQEALRYQTTYFQGYDIEESWLFYSSSFADGSNWMRHAASPFGDPETDEASAGRFSIARGNAGRALHGRWREARASSLGFSSPEHPFRHRGSGKAYTYKLFLEQAHALLRDGGRLGFIVPSGLHSDHGTRALRELFLNSCRWEWLFGFENREKLFDIDSRFKFNAVIVQKGGRTAAIRTAFMRRKLEDWEHAEDHVALYSLEQIDRFSPRSKAILEVQSERDLQILEKIYSNSVLLGDDGPDGWGITYAQGDFNMTSHSKLFPPLPKWEEQGYRPDEYSRWLLGDWRPIGELWTELGVEPLREGESRCAQPPYDQIPFPRADLPEGVILSRQADEWIREDRIEDVALPLYQGVMLWQLDSARSDYLGGANHSARWERRAVYAGYLPEPQFLIGRDGAAAKKPASVGSRVGFRAVQNATNQRTMIASLLPGCPAGNSLGTIRCPGILDALLSVFLCDLAYDFSLRPRMSQANLNWFILAETPVPRPATVGRWAPDLIHRVLGLCLPQVSAAEYWQRVERFRKGHQWRSSWSATQHERSRQRCVLDAVGLALRGMSWEDVTALVSDCVYPKARLEDRSFYGRLYVKGFWRVDRDKDPELRQTVLALIAFHDLERHVTNCDGDLDRGIESFLSQNDGEGWMLPETLCLADYGLGHDDRAKEHQPVASRLGPRFYDWQLAQDAEESWRECQNHGVSVTFTRGTC